MKNLTTILQEARSSAVEEAATIDVEQAQELGIAKRHNLFGSHTVVTSPPLDALRPVNGDATLADISLQPEVDAYVHIPYCEYPCQFCPYTTVAPESGRAQGITTYREALETEVRTWGAKLREQGSQIRSLYLGGGTPFALPQKELEGIIRFLKETLPFTEDPAICVETSPRATLEDSAQAKLQMLSAYGVNRMSIGIQSFDFASLRDMARTFKGHKPGDEARAVRRLLESGIPHVNVDMIQDLPNPSGDDEGRLLYDLEQIAELQPQHVTWYKMRLNPETTYARRNAPDVTERESLATRLTIWNAMADLGYEVLEGDRFALEDKFEDRFRKARGSVRTSLIGMGVSSYSHVDGMFFQNPRVIGGAVRQDSKEAIAQYIEAVAEKGHAITFGFPLTSDEMLAGTFALGLKKGVQLDAVVREFGTDVNCKAYVDQVLVPNLTSLVDADMLQVTDGRIEFTRKGRLHENEICALFYTPEAIESAHMRRGSRCYNRVEILNDMNYRLQREIDNDSQDPETVTQLEEALTNCTSGGVSAELARQQGRKATVALAGIGAGYAGFVTLALLLDKLGVMPNIDN